jgi:hypothetical protein
MPLLLLLLVLVVARSLEYKTVLYSVKKTESAPYACVAPVFWSSAETLEGTIEYRNSYIGHLNRPEVFGPANCSTAWTRLSPCVLVNALPCRYYARDGDCKFREFEADVLAHWALPKFQVVA